MIVGVVELNHNDKIAITICLLKTSRLSVCIAVVDNPLHSTNDGTTTKVSKHEAIRSQ